ncbi:hypothetical protein MPNT_170040 [Candidatus Methylacidithermus pantelleriae]|uniref:Uncharacterized protein n=1 Tax=Candidatus Methylacidithermus pantelleriae TaxID=2744239 RepID=A0A8J2FNB6_9BACT|nr:hypothetical protein MPNT_170040 [Candidatus Methylacidithermus pantelleriae]
MFFDRCFVGKKWRRPRAIGARRQSWVASAKEMLAEIPREIAQRADPVTLGSPVGWGVLLPSSP